MCIRDSEMALKILEEKNKLIENVFQEASKKLKKIVEEEVYLKSLARLIETSAPQIGEEKLKVKFNSKDLKRKSEIMNSLKLPSNLKLTVDEHPINTMGGCIILTQDENIKIDETFETRLVIARKVLKKEVSKILFE